MFRTVGVAIAALAVAGAAAAQSTTTTRTSSTTTTTRDGDTTTTTTTTRETSTSVGFDAGAFLDALADAADRGQDERRAGPRGQPARLEDAVGTWVVSERRGFGPGDCRLELAEKGLFGNRGVRKTDCPGGVREIGYWTLENGEVVLRKHDATLIDRLRLADGVLVGREYMLLKPGSAAPSWEEAWLDGAGSDRRRSFGRKRFEPADAAGVWKTVEESSFGRRECQVTLRDQQIHDAFGASSFGCSAEFFSVFSWRLEDGQVAIYKPGGALIVLLRGDGRRLAGRTDAGKEIVLYR